MRFTKYALRELIVFGALSGLLMVAVLVVTLTFLPNKAVALLVSLPFVVLFVLVISFFRDPERVPPRGEHRLVAPADGTIFDIGDVAESVFVGEDCLRIGIFMSVFNCHVTRAPCSGRVEKILHTKGTFLSALTKAKECSEQNESNLVGLADVAGAGARVAVKQIAGQIARRIVCDLREGDAVERGQRFGMIKFGSRVELFVPKSANFTLKAKLGASVKGGRTILGTLGPAPAAGADAVPNGT